MIQVTWKNAGIMEIDSHQSDTAKIDTDGRLVVGKDYHGTRVLAVYERGDWVRYVQTDTPPEPETHG